MRSLSPDPPEPAGASPLIEAAAASGATPDQALVRARALAEPLLANEVLDTGENTLAHADAVAAILRSMGASEVMQAASYLVHASLHLNRPQEVIAKAFGDSLASLAIETNQLVQVQRQARSAQARAAASGAQPAALPSAPTPAAQLENVRKMLLAFSRDLRVVMLRLASRLQTLRYHAQARLAPPQALALEALDVFAPLANRLGIRDLKWELEDLAFRFLEPETYRAVAGLLDGTRTQREQRVLQLREALLAGLQQQGIRATVQGRPKHIYSIVRKMRGKSLGFDQVYDLLALRVVVADVPGCYAALAWVHSRFTPVAGEFDDYIARPKGNGYRSLHTIVRDEQGHPIEIQIRTQAMHDHAEHGVAAHWAYKEAGVKGYAGVSASSAYDAKIAVLRQLLAWERDLSGTASAGVLEDRIYVLTPDAAIVELPQGGTPVDFAYSLHTSLGHRCRGARVDGVMVPLNTPLKNGQTVEITSAREGGPSRDWLNPDLGYLASHRARAKVRAWFNALALSETVARGREAVEKLLQREGRTALRLDDLATQLGFETAEPLFVAVGKDEFSLRAIENLLHPPGQAVSAEQPLIRKARADADSARGGLLVVGMDSLMTQLARCCKPAPPDAIRGFVTRGKGVSVHRADCSNLREIAARHAERLIEVAWGEGQRQPGGAAAVYAVDVAIEASDRQGLLRDISDVFAKEKINVTGVQTQSLRGTAWMTFTVEVSDSSRLGTVLRGVLELPGVRSARRR
ncbi:MAG: bifunctional (p)ppGpp synthetase/guanosine-3',5'-bis(diphosphate) 3'-pyrophosphohydrolase [Rhodoferax sp.]|nr:bifunctional (p)ppGpp synthetase/guanosine-3',5'-bis(diphosphate) 3'-pyrophosphohydrolase [Rhodoferax sp.]